MTEKKAKHIVKVLQDAGHDAVFAGGAVRDKLLGVKPHDFDIATSAIPEEVELLFKKTVPVGKQFGIIVVLFEGEEFEVATLRRDSNDSDGRRPNKVEFSSMKEDAFRRDLTINALFFDPIKEKIFDFVHGEKDLRNRVVKFVGNASKRIEEDKLRMMRAIRFASKLDFKLDSDAFEAIKDGVEDINQVSSERLFDEMSKILLSDKPSSGVEMLLESGLLGKVLPEVEALKFCEQSPKWHQEGDTFVHSMMVLDHTREKTSKLSTLWGALLHDVGKPAAFKVEDGVIKAHSHDKLGAEIADAIMRRFHTSTEMRETVVALVKDHMRVGSVKDMKKAKLRRFVAEPHFVELAKLFESDCESSFPDDLNREDKKLEGVKFIKDFLSNEVVELPKPLLSGKDLIELGFKPGPKFKEILEDVEDERLEGKINSKEEAIERVRSNFFSE